MILNTVLDALASKIDAIASLRVYPYPADQVTPPAAIVGLPDVPYDITQGDGSQEWVIPVWVVVGKVSDRASRTALCDYVNPSGANSVKAAIEADKTLGGTCDSVSVLRATFQSITVAATDYLAAEFAVDVVG